jgi:hypothetical protein
MTRLQGTWENASSRSFLKSINDFDNVTRARIDDHALLVHVSIFIALNAVFRRNVAIFDPAPRLRTGTALLLAVDGDCLDRRADQRQDPGDEAALERLWVETGENVVEMVMRRRKPGNEQDERKDRRYAGRIRLAVAANRSAKSLCGFFDGAVAPRTLLVTDDWRGFPGLRKRGYDCHAIAECGDPEVAEEFLPIIHLVFANLKTWLICINHGVSAQHLHACLNEFTFRFNQRFYPFNASRSFLGIVGDVKAPTYAELYSGDWTHPTYGGHGLTG